jgi:hypothetical protein
MNIQYFPSDILKLCDKYLSPDEITYIKCDWNNFPKDKICEIAAVNNWLDLLIWARQNNCEWNYLTCMAAASQGILHKFR